MDILDRYNIYIKERYESLVKSGNEFDNYNLSKIFEYYSCIQLTKKYNQEFREYDDIHPEFKEQNKMSRNDTGIDACNLIDTIVQCKLRKDTLTWEQCGTFFGSQNVFDSTLKKTIVRWNNLIITRNKESQLSKNYIYQIFFLWYEQNFLVYLQYNKLDSNLSHYPNHDMYLTLYLTDNN